MKFDIEIKKSEVNKDAEDKSSKLVVSKEDLIRTIVHKNRNLVQKYLLENKPNYNNLMNNLAINSCTVDTGIVFCPEELISSYILAHLIKYSVVTGYRIWRSSDIVDVYFGKDVPGLPKTVNAIKTNRVIVILDGYDGEHSQKVLIQLMENRLMHNLKTMFIVPVYSGEFDGRYPILDSFFFDESNIKERFNMDEVFVLKQEYTTKVGNWRKVKLSEEIK